MANLAFSDVYKRLFEASPQGIGITTLEGRFVHANQALLDILGYAQTELLSMTVEDITPQEYREAERIRMARAVKQGASNASFEKEYVRKDGGKVSVSVLGLILMDEQGRPDGLAAFVTDISRRREAERALGATAKQLEAIMDYSPSAIFIRDLKGRYVMVNRAACEVLGRPAKEILGRTNEELFPVELAQIFSRQDESVIDQGQAIQAETRMEVRGRELFMVQTKFPLRDSGGRIYAVCGVATDISMRHRAEERLRLALDDLSNQKQLLEETNIALKVLLRQRDEDRHVVEERIVSNIKELVEPYLERLRSSGLDGHQKHLIELIQGNLNDVLSPMADVLSSRFYSLTPAELRVANLVRHGKTSQEVAELLHLSKGTVDLHRSRIRAKLGIRGKNANLRGKLAAMTLPKTSE